MEPERELIESLRQIEAKYARRPLLDAEANATDPATCIRRLLDIMAQREPCLETRFSMPDPWCARILGVLFCRYGVEGYRYSGQRRSTVMVRLPRRFVDEVLYPMYWEMSNALHEYLSEITRRVLAEALPLTGVSHPKERAQAGERGH